MIELARVANNALVIAILFGIGYAIYMGMKGKKPLEKLRLRFIGGKK